jgi:class 3 adenylate cyclase
LPHFKSEKNHAIAITAFAVEMMREMEAFIRENPELNLKLRIGVHTGKVVGGVVGIKKPRYLIWGNHTVIANSMESKSLPGHIQISESTYQKLKDCNEYTFIPRGQIDIGGSETMSTYFLEVFL